MMNWKRQSKSLVATCWTIARVGTVTLLTTGVAFAQEPAKPGDKATWTMGYALVVMAIGLGLMVVCRPGTRTADFKVVDDDDD